MEVAKYRVAEGDDWREFEKLVNDLIKAGWQPLGGLSTWKQYYSQAMVKTEKEEEAHYRD